MKVKKLVLFYIDQDYIEMLNEVDQRPEAPTGNVYHNKNDIGYRYKPYIGILTQDGRSYAVPMTSAKDWHKNKENVFADEFQQGILVYSYIDKRKSQTPKNGKPRILADLPEDDPYFVEHPEIKKEDKPYIKKWILNVCDIQKMVPIPYGVSERVSFKIQPKDDRQTKGRKDHLRQQYFGVKACQKDLERLTSNLYDRQKSNPKIVGSREPDLENLEIASDIWSDYLQDKYDRYVDSIYGDYMFNGKNTKGKKKEPFDKFLNRKYQMDEIPKYIEFTLNQHNKKQKRDFESFLQREYETTNIKEAIEIFKESENENNLDYD